jgi:hypothetical protein
LATWDFPALRVHVERARAYVLAHGGSREQARLAGILSGERPPKPVVTELEALQQADGGFPWEEQTGNPSSIETTCVVLAQLKDLPPLAGSPMASRAVAYLRRQQQVNGSWQEVAATEHQGSSYLTAHAMFSILTLEADHRDPVLRGMRWLSANLGVPDNAATYGLAAATAVRLGGTEALLVADRCTAAFYAHKETSAHNLASFLTCALEAPLGGAHLLPIIGLLTTLASQQQDDGSWPGATKTEQVERTLTALRVAKGFGVL